MSRRLTVAPLVAALAASPSCGGSSPEAGAPEHAEDVAAQKAAESWLAALDAGNYDESWSQSATVFRAGNGSPANWASAASEMRGPLGRVVSRRLKEAAPTNLQEGAAYALAYDTVFEGRPQAVEEVTIILDGGLWKVAGYLVK